MLLLHLILLNLGNLFRGGDDFLPIFIYVVIKANVPNVYSELSFMELFIDDTQAIEREGYLLATLQVCIKHKIYIFN